MDKKEFLDFIKLIHKKLLAKYPLEKKDRIMAKSLKVMEEFGELSNEILTYYDLQSRTEKKDNFDYENLKSEWVDVLMTVLLLGVDLDISFADVEKRFSKIRKRFAK